MPSIEGEFERLFPIAQFSDAEAVAPLRDSDDGIVASVACRRITPPNSFDLALATRGGVRLGPFLLTPTVAAEIRKALVDSGF